MSKSKNYEPGTVAMVTTTVGTFLAVRGAAPADGYPWFRPETRGFVSDWAVDNVRPLVVVDPLDDEQMARLVTCLKNHDVAEKYEAALPSANVRAALLEFADPTPPVEEPTLPEAKVRDAKGRVWDLKSPDDPFGQWLHVADEANLWKTWARIPQPVEVLFEGVKTCACGKPDAYALTPGERIDHGPDACVIMTGVADDGE